MKFFDTQGHSIIKFHAAERTDTLYNTADYNPTNMQHFIVFLTLI